MNKISVVILTKDSYPYIQRSLQSLRNQKLKPDEIVVIDKESRDGTLEFLSQNHDITIFSQTTEGLAQARNEAIEKCRGEFIAFLDSDDEWYEDKLQIQYRELKEDQALAGVTCLLIKRNGSRLSDKKYKALTPSGFLFHRSTFEIFGRFDPQYKIGCDHAWIIQAQRQGFPFKVIPEVLMIKNLHESNLSSDKSLYLKEVMEILRRHS